MMRRLKIPGSRTARVMRAFAKNQAFHVEGLRLLAEKEGFEPSIQV
jgi:hypothetical protein